MGRGRFANVSQCFVTGIMGNWRFGNGQTGIYGLDPIAISVVMYYDCAATASLILSVGNGLQGRGVHSILLCINITHISTAGNLFSDRIIGKRKRRARNNNN